jgi:XTP/dITP diphosphohydrolase
MAAPIQLFVATSNPGKIREYRMMTDASGIELLSIPGLEKLPEFEEAAPTFAENAAGKAMHYSCFVEGTVLADDSGLVVPALGGRPGVQSARYAGPGAIDEDRVRKLLQEMQGKEGEQRRARFVCISALAKNGRALAVVSDFVEGILTNEPRGNDGFGYDPIFFFAELDRTYAETTREEKNRFSHRGKAFRKIVKLLTSPESATSL